MIIGFTGTHWGMTLGQRDMVRDALRLLTDITHVHHGDCIGADADFDALCREVLPGSVIVIHPPSDSSKRAFCRVDSPMINLQPTKQYLRRNHDIVECAELMFAVSGTNEEVLRSGTWSTVRYARKLNKPIFIFYPHGVVLENATNDFLVLVRDTLNVEV